MNPQLWRGRAWPAGDKCGDSTLEASLPISRPASRRGPRGEIINFPKLSHERSQRRICDDRMQARELEPLDPIGPSRAGVSEGRGGGKARDEGEGLRQPLAMGYASLYVQKAHAERAAQHAALPTPAQGRPNRGDEGGAAWEGDALRGGGGGGAAVDEWLESAPGCAPFPLPSASYWCGLPLGETPEIALREGFPLVKGGREVSAERAGVEVGVQSSPGGPLRLVVSHRNGWLVWQAGGGSAGGCR